MAHYLGQVGFTGEHAVQLFGELDEALEWVEEQVSAAARAMSSI